MKLVVAKTGYPMIDKEHKQQLHLSLQAHDDQQSSLNVGSGNLQGYQHHMAWRRPNLCVTALSPTINFEDKYGYQILEIDGFQEGDFVNKFTSKVDQCRDRDSDCRHFRKFTGGAPFWAPVHPISLFSILDLYRLLRVCLFLITIQWIFTRPRLMSYNHILGNFFVGAR
jgi:hypothetical protein